MKCNAFVAAMVLGGLAVGGIGLSSFVTPTPLDPILNKATVGQALREDLAAFALGGFRVLAADVAWLQMWSKWEGRDWPATEARIRLACALEPRSLYFWLNGARIMAYDAPAWQQAGRGMVDLRRGQAEAALEFLHAAESVHRQDPRLWIERAGLELYGRGDYAAAAACYRRAAELPGSPLFAGRLHAQLLRRLGRAEEALAWLVHWHPTLRAVDADVALDRIRELEQELGVPPEKSYPVAARSVESATLLPR